MSLWAALFVIFASVSVHARTAQPCVLSWDPSNSSSIAGYAVYYGITGTDATNRLDVGAVETASINNLVASSNYYFFVVAYDVNGMESEPSNILNYTPEAMSSLKLAQLNDGTMRLSLKAGVGTTCRVEFTDSLEAPQWTLLEYVVADSNGDVIFNDPPEGRPDKRFYRTVLP